MSRLPVGHFVDVGDGHRIHYHERGPQAGPVLVFVHGSGPGASGYSNFKQNLDAFADAGFRVLVPDTIGFGYSSKPEDQAYSLDFMTGILSSFLDALGIGRCALVGNSLGGAMCIALTLAKPERITKLVLMAPGGLEVRERYFEMKGIRTMLKAIFAPEGPTAESMRKVFGLQLFDATQVTEETLAERLAIAATQPKVIFETMSVPHLAPRLVELDLPVLGLWGVDDQFCPVEGAMTLARNIKRCRVTLFSQCGHWVMVEHPRNFERLVLDFLAEP